jgi:hypothetical protein
MVQKRLSFRRAFSGILSILMGITFAISMVIHIPVFFQYSMGLQWTIFIASAVLFSFTIFFCLTRYLWQRLRQAGSYKHLVAYMAIACILGIYLGITQGFTPVPERSTPQISLVAYQLVDAVSLFGLCSLFFIFSHAKLDLLALTGLVLIVNLPYFNPAFIPTHDTGQSYQIFHYLYDGFYFNRAINQWDPYQGYGLWYGQTLATLTSLSTWPILLLGSLLRVTDSLLLYKLSILCQHLVFLLGLYLFSGLVFKQRSTVLLVCIAAITTTIWCRQLYFDWNIYYLLPLVLYLLVRFFIQNRPEYFWLAGITGVVWSYGSIYLPSIWIFVLAIFTIIMTLLEPKIWLSLFERTWKNITGFALFAFMATCYGYLLLHSTDSLIIITPGRDPLTLKTSLETFLTYGGTGTSVVPSLIFGWPVGVQMGNTEVVFYTGLLCLPFFLWGIARERSRVYLSMLAATLAVILLAQGGLFAVFVYHIPVVNYFRHLGYLYGLIKIMLIICAGFGWENFWHSTTNHRWLLNCTCIFLFVLDFSFLIKFRPQIISAIGYLGNINQIHMSNRVDISGLLFFCLRLACYLTFLVAALVSSKTFQTRKKLSAENGFTWIKTFLLVALLFDTLSFQFIAYQILRIQHLEDSFYTSITAFPLTYQDQRSESPPTLRQQQAYTIMMNPAYSWEWVSTIYAFAQFDSCNFGSNQEGDIRYSMISKDVQKLLEARASIHGLATDPALLNVLGCNAPKIRLMTSVRYTEDDELTMQIIRETTKLDQVLVLTAPSANMTQQSSENETFNHGTVDVTHFEANHIIMEANVTAQKGAWLVYADAWHPGWQATVNGKQVQIFKAYGAFKAIWLENGQSHVSFEFNNGILSSLNWVIFVTGVLFYAVLLLVFAKLLFPGSKTSEVITR